MYRLLSKPGVLIQAVAIVIGNNVLICSKRNITANVSDFNFIDEKIIKFPNGNFILHFICTLAKGVWSETFLWEITLNSSTRINNPVELGQYLFKERKHLKLTQKEISEFADVGRKFIIELEKGKATAQLGKVFELLNSLGLELHLLKHSGK